MADVLVEAGKRVEDMQLVEELKMCGEGGGGSGWVGGAGGAARGGSTAVEKVVEVEEVEESLGGTSVQEVELAEVLAVWSR